MELESVRAHPPATELECQQRSVYAGTFPSTRVAYRISSGCLVAPSRAAGHELFPPTRSAPAPGAPTRFAHHSAARRQACMYYAPRLLFPPSEACQTLQPGSSCRHQVVGAVVVVLALLAKVAASRPAWRAGVPDAAPIAARLT